MARVRNLKSTDRTWIVEMTYSVGSLSEVTSSTPCLAVKGHSQTNKISRHHVYILSIIYPTIN